MAIPVLAVIELDATPGQVAWPAFLGQLPPALLALHAGALAGRRAERRQMITGDLVSATALATVPVAAALDALTLAQLMVVAAVQGAAGGVHDAAAISLLPTLVDRSLIQRSNSRIGSLFAIAATGPDAGREHLADLRRPAAGRAARRRARHAGRRTRRAGRRCLPARRPPCGPGPFAAARPAADACPSVGTGRHEPHHGSTACRSRADRTRAGVRARRGGLDGRWFAVTQPNTGGAEAGPTATALPEPCTATPSPAAPDPQFAAARAEMVARLEEAGDLGPGPVLDALLALPRETLMPQAYVRRSIPHEPPRRELLDWVRPDDREELPGLLHSGISVSVQHEGEPILGRVAGVRSGGAMTAMSSTMGMTADLPQRLDRYS